MLQEAFLSSNADQDRQSERKAVRSLKDLREFLRSINEENDSEDEGITDYNIGGYHTVHIGEVLFKRYVVIEKLGWGHFSTVWLCKDFKHSTYVAVKIQKSSPQYMQAAFDEVEILQKVDKHYQDLDWEGKSRDDTHVVGMLNAFIHKTPYGNHFCMVFEILRCNLLDLLKRYNFEGLSLPVCQEISRQVLLGLDYLHRICGVIHTDLKPENVMLCLSKDEIRQIVQHGQLANTNLFSQRLKLVSRCLGRVSETGRVSSIEQKLKQSILTRNQKRNLKKKLKKQLAKGKQNTGVEDEETELDGECLEDLFDITRGKISFKSETKLSMPFRVKIADLGNACWLHHHFSSQIQTRQYRSPEVVLRQTFNATADIWSLACMMYEMFTGDLLFQPKKTEEFSKNDDHLAQMQELIGPFHPNFIRRSPCFRKYFTNSCQMKHFPSLSHYSLDVILSIKHHILPDIARNFAAFLMPMLVAEPERRASAQECLAHQWLRAIVPDNCRMYKFLYAGLRKSLPYCVKNSMLMKNIFNRCQSPFKIFNLNRLGQVVMTLKQKKTSIGWLIFVWLIAASQIWGTLDSATGSTCKSLIVLPICSFCDSVCYH